MNRAAKVVTELLFAASASGVLHMENPRRQPWAAILSVFARTLGVAGSLPYDAWLAQVQAAPLDAAANPCVKIVPFLEDEFVRMATGQVVLDTAVAQRLSPALRASGPLEEEHLVRYAEYWKQEGFLA